MSDDLRCLTVRQPWAWAIIHAGKDVENRSRSIAGAYRGLVAIHAEPARGVVPLDTARVMARAWRASPLWSVERNHRQHGHVIGVVDLIDVHGAVPGGETRCSPWAQPDCFHLVLTNPRPLPEPIPARGRLGLWRPDEALRAAILDLPGAVA